MKPKKRTFPGPRHVPGKMNKLEAQYAAHLESLKIKGEILDYVFEGITFKLANRCTYTPDFLVIHPGHFSIHEVKGFWRDDARVKWKAAAEKFKYFQFVAVTRKKKEWVFEYY